MSVQSVEFLQVGWFGLVMGVASLALVARAAGSLGMPALVGVGLALAAAALEGVILAAYLRKLWLFPSGVRAELTSPSTMGFSATAPVSLMLIGGCLAPWIPTLATAVWWLGAATLLAYQVGGVARWMRGGFDVLDVNAGWMVLALGGLPAPISGAAVGQRDVALILFGVAIAASPLMMTLVFWRTLTGPPVPPALKPASFILLVPPALLYAGYPADGAALPFWVTAAFYFDVMLAACLVAAARDVHRWPFGVSWAAFTFPLSALAAASVRHASLEPSSVATGLAWATIALASIAAATVLARAVVRLRGGALLQPVPLAQTFSDGASRAPDRPSIR